MILAGSVGLEALTFTGGATVGLHLKFEVSGKVQCIGDFRERAAMFDHTVRGALSRPHNSRAPGSATLDHARVRDSNAAQGNTQDMEATSVNLSRKECQGCSETRRPSRPASRIQSSGAIVTPQPWIQLAGGYARWCIGVRIGYSCPGTRNGPSGSQ
jgi:hypothetical protein